VEDVMPLVLGTGPAMHYKSL